MGFDDMRATVAFFVDITKAFASANYDIFKVKLKQYDKNCFKSYVPYKNSK